MSGAFSLLAVNFCIALIFAVLFLALAAKSPSRRAALLFGVGFAIASYSAIGEAMLLVSDYTRFFAMGAFASVLGGLCVLTLGIGEYYRVPLNRMMIATLFVTGFGIDCVIFDLPRGTVAHSIPYQAPFFLIQTIAAGVVFRSGRRSMADRILLALLSLTALYFLLKAYAAIAAGAGPDARSYLFSQFALISQGLGAVLIVAIGLALVGILVREIIEDAVASSDIDPLSGLLNRRGFGKRVAPLLELRGGALPGTLILADLDHFKRINDRFGHQAGDKVIQLFADLLRSSAPKDAAVGRIGGEEFAVYLPVADAECGRMFALGVRSALAGHRIDEVRDDFRITSSFGVAEFERDETLEEAMRRADAVLYAAKAAGRDQVMVAGAVSLENPTTKAMRRVE